MGLLQQLKDYDCRLTQKLKAEAFQQQERQKLEVFKTHLISSECINTCFLIKGPVIISFIA